MTAGLFALGLAIVGPATARQFVSGIDLVEVYATVVTRSGTLVDDLGQSEFIVFEDGRRVTVSVFAAGDFPLAVALAVDRSWSMAGRPLALARTAALNFLHSLRSTDRSMVIVIGGEASVLSPLSTDRSSQLESIAALQPWGTTNLHDAIIAGVDLIEPAGGRRALVLLSDGSERYSVATAAEAAERVRGAGVLVYPVSVGTSRPPLFGELAAVSGGRSFHVTDPERLTDVLTAISLELRHQYLLGYVPAATPEPGWRSIRVDVTRPGVRVRARRGYFYRPSSSIRSRQASPISSVPMSRRLRPR